MQNIENRHWDLKEVNVRLLKEMLRSVDLVVDRWQQLGGLGAVDFRTSCALERVTKVALEHGVRPKKSRYWLTELAVDQKRSRLRTRTCQFQRPPVKFPVRNSSSVGKSVEMVPFAAF